MSYSIYNYILKNYVGIVSALVLAYILYLIYSFFREEGGEMNEPNRTGKNYKPVPYDSVKTANFHIKELTCKDGTKVPDQYTGNALRLLTNLQVLRDYLGVPIVVNSGYRTPKHNESEDGATNSSHLYAMAGDIKAIGKTPKQVHTAILALIKAGKMQDGGLSLYRTFVHYDINTPRRW